MLAFCASACAASVAPARKTQRRPVKELVMPNAVSSLARAASSSIRTLMPFPSVARLDPPNGAGGRPHDHTVGCDVMQCSRDAAKHGPVRYARRCKDHVTRRQVVQTILLVEILDT